MDISRITKVILKKLLKQKVGTVAVHRQTHTHAEFQVCRNHQQGSVQYITSSTITSTLMKSYRGTQIEKEQIQRVHRPHDTFAVAW